MIAFGVLKVRSAVHKAALIHGVIDDYGLDVLALSETWITSDAPPAVKNAVAPNGFNVLHVHREIVPDGRARGGRLAILHRDSIPVLAFDLVGAPRPTTYERQMVRIVAPSSSSVVVANIYRPPSAPISSYIDELDDLLGNIISDSNNKILLRGDFNCPGLDETHIGLLTVLESY